MYLSSKQHDQLQIIVTGFEIPYRSYITSAIIKKFPNECDFTAEILSKAPYPESISEYRVINSEFGKLKANTSKIYKLFSNANEAKEKHIIVDEIDVPNIVCLITTTLIFKELFSPLFLRFKDEETYLMQATKYKYVRNKLDHRGCKTLETPDMNISLDFISNVCLFLNNYGELYFLDKSYTQISKEIISLQTSEVQIPISIHNILDMPFSNMKIVCRDKEIDDIKQFVYGYPGALRKNASYVLFGYGGVGKTALVLEAIKQIVQDLQDGTTVNGYKPDFILFFTAKEEILSFSRTTGNIQNVPNRYTFKTAEQLFNSIYRYLEITSFVDYNKSGLIVIDNLESLLDEDRIKIEKFIQFNSPQQIQYIITSRNEENYEIRKKLAGFDDNVAGHNFIETYISENNLDMTLSEQDYKILLQIALGNTLVLVLCLRRLGLNLTTISGITSDISTPVTVKKIREEISSIPANGYNIISEYMFKNSFQEIQEIYKENSELMTVILKIFAVYPADTIDIYTISMLSKRPYNLISPILELLCQYLIIEKTGETYSLNQFAAKYIIQLFMPDAEAYAKIESEIVSSTRKIQTELNDLQENINNNSSLKLIIQDWNVISDGDKIAVAKAFREYGIVKKDCESMNKFHIESALCEAISMMETLEQNTMHPYIKFQKARVLQLISHTYVLEQDFSKQIIQAYNETVWTIKVNSVYSSIKVTKSYASVLWMYGLQLFSLNTTENYQYAARYLEESKDIFELLHNIDKEYYECIILLGRTYLKLYLADRTVNLPYLRKARTISNDLYAQRNGYFGKTKGRAIGLKNELQKYGNF